MSDDKRINTAKQIAKLVSDHRGSDKRKEVAISDEPGLRFRISETGRTSWIYRYRTPDRKTEQMVLGQFPAMGLADARESVSEQRRVRRETGSPRLHRLEARRARLAELTKARERAELASYTFRAMVWQFLDGYGDDLRPKTRAEYQRIFERDVFPKIGSRPAASVTADELDALISEKRALAPVLAQRISAAISSAYGWANRQKRLSVNPSAELRQRTSGGHRARTAKQRQESAKGGRSLSVEEVRKLMRGLPAGMPDDVARATEVMLRTGQRPSEVAAMAWEEINLGTREWQIAPERYKTGEGHSIILPPQVIALLGPPGAGYVFPRKRRDGAVSHLRIDVSLHEFQEGLQRLGIKKARQHDLRITCETLMVDELDVNENVAHHGVTGHKRTGIKATYQRARLMKQSAEALQRWSDWLDAMKADNVTPIGARRG